MLRLGVVSFLNSRPLIDGLDERNGVRCLFDVPAALPGHLASGELDAALIPLVDLLRSPGRYRVVSDACIASDGETMTVRVFAQVPPDRIRTLWVDADSHTSVALATVLWRQLFKTELTVRPLSSKPHDGHDAEAVLLIGDKVVDPGRGSFGYEVDLGGAWRQHTGLPFVFAVWACPNAGRGGKHPPTDERQDGLSALLSRARDRGVARAGKIAENAGPALGWPVELARRYLTRCLCYRLDARAVEGAELFARHCAAAGLVPADASIPWPRSLAPSAASVAP